MQVPPGLVQQSADAPVAPAGNLLDLADPWANAPNEPVASPSIIDGGSGDDMSTKEEEHVEDDDDASCYKLATDIIKQLESYHSCLNDWKKEEDNNTALLRSVYVNTPSKASSYLTSHSGQTIQTEYPITHVQLSRPDIMYVAIHSCVCSFGFIFMYPTTCRSGHDFVRLQGSALAEPEAGP